jgi:GTP-binding protein
MKIMADAALVGMPSVGKSSLIARMSAARPKIADYPFTTLIPNLGMVYSGDHNFVVADVPGLIEGAAQGKGLGHEFLRHIERTALILHVVDATGGWEQRDPLDDYLKINAELADYGRQLADRPQIVVINKVDVEGTSKTIDRLKQAVYEQALAKANGNEFSKDFKPPPVFCVSAITGAGLDSLIAATAQMVFELRSEAQHPIDNAVQYEQVWEHQRQARDKHFEVRNLGGGVYAVSGKAVERMVIQTEWDNEEAIAHLQRRLEKIGVEKALVEKGARNGDEIRILSRAFAFESALMPDDENVDNNEAVVLDTDSNSHSKVAIEENSIHEPAISTKTKTE